MPWSVSVVMTQLLPLYTGQGQLNLSETPRRRPGCGETRTRVSPLPSQCCCHDLTPPGSCRPQEVGARSLIDSTGNSEWSSACPGRAWGTCASSRGAAPSARQSLLTAPAAPAAEPRSLLPCALQAGRAWPSRAGLPASLLSST